ncbi:hypothetical protein GCM10007881_15960 [Mesorhizobium huakuii]|uniref:hypothetical protein n=1 Tax=Mesorhizobium huakuii TaxID=28104 RepID=UPI00235C3AD2|nr:hypothetical protein [Mesorhizobium huakuii]GLQ78080.1 hypothetical protein GCM10007881_15960 [Mesorhizobium huakuii]
MSRKRAWLTAFVPHRLELLVSPPWQLAPVPLRRMLERLEIEHLRHGGQNNGQLYVSFGQFEAASISRRKIVSTQALGAELGLMETIRSSEPVGDLRAPNAYRLTYVEAKGGVAPTDEWKRITKDRAERLIDAYHNAERAEVKSRQARAA